MKRHIIWFLMTMCALFVLFAGCKEQHSEETEGKTLTLAVFKNERSNLLQWVNLYNENHSDVKIEIVNYSDNYSDPYGAIDQIKLEISAGKGPDMVNFGELYSPLDVSCGIMTDLSPIMQNDELFDEQDLYYNVLKAFEVGDSLYALVPSYMIDTYATVNEELVDLERMNIKQLVDAYNKLDSESILFPGETQKTVFGMICYGSLENYIDWGEGTCHFNDANFKELLCFANQFPASLNWTEDYSAKSVFAEGRALLYPVSIESVYDITSTRVLFNKTPTYIGYPFDSGGGNMAAIADLAIGISSTSKNKEEAWEFLKSLLSSEFQNSISTGLPIRISSLEQKLEDAMGTEYDVNGEKVVKEVLNFAGEEPDHIYEMSAEDVEILKSIISGIEHTATVDRNLYNILLEETSYLFDDGRNIDDVADIIQNRVNVYISENK